MTARLCLVVTCALLTTSVACMEKGSDDDEVEVMTEMPDYGGCTYDVAFDREDDGSVNYTTTQEFDALQQTVYYRYEDDEGPFLESFYDYDGACLQGYEIYSVDGDGSWLEQQMDYSCDEHDNPTFASGPYVYGDEGEDGTELYLEWTWTNAYDGDKLVEMELEVWEPNYEQVLLAYTMTYEWEGENMVLAERWEDGERTSWEAWTYDADGRTLTWEEGSEGYDWSEAYTYDEHGRPNDMTWSSDSEASSGRELRTWYDAIYEVQQVVQDEGDDGAADTTWDLDCTDSWPWSCDGTIDGDSDDSGPSDGTTDHSYTVAWSCP